MIEPTIKTESLEVYHADAFDVIHQLRGGAQVDCIITDPPYWTLNKWRSVGTTTRLGGHRDADKREGWFDEIDREQLWELMCEFSLLLPKNGHAWIFADNEVQSIIQGFVREGETRFNYVKSLSERFRDDLHAWLRGMAICLDMVGNAGTHSEKNARLRGAIEVTEQTIQKVIDQRFNFDNPYWRWKDTFASDFPTREILEQKHRLADEVQDLKRQLAEAKGVSVEEIITPQ